VTTSTVKKQGKALSHSGEWLKCRLSPEYFFRNYVYLQDRGRTSTILFEPWPHLIDLLRTLVENRQVILLKSRQIGATWLVCGYCVWKAKFFENAKILILSQGETEAFDSISKCRFIDDNLPDFFKTKRNPDQRGHIAFPDMKSEIVALPSTEKAGRSTDASIIVCDEWEYHPHAETNFGALRPTIGGGGQFIGLSTTDKTKLNTFFKSKYIEAKGGSGNFKPLFYNWRVVPSRDDEWFAEETKDLRPWQIEQEYPETEADALTILKTRLFFDENALGDMRANVSKPVKHPLSDKYSDLVRIYKPPVVGQKYLVFTDPSDGKEDPHAIIVTDSMGEEVACSHGMTPADLCAQIHDELVRLYFDALNGYESNSRAGGIFSEKLVALETPNQCGFLKTDGKLDKSKNGWWTSKTLWNKFIWGLEEAVRLRQVTIRSIGALDEMSLFMVPEGEDPQKPRGGHDDYIDAWARVWHLRKYVPTGGFKIGSFKYRD